MGREDPSLGDQTRRWVVFLPSKAILLAATMIDRVHTTMDAIVKAMLHEFPYYDNYVDLVRLELSAISSLAVDKPRHKYAVIGSGPLPLTSICLADALNKDDHQHICIHNVDRDPWVISSSEELCCRLGYGPIAMSFHCVDAQSGSIGFQEFDVVYLAALVGMTTEAKRDIVVEISSRMRPGALLLIRSSHSLRSLIYPVR